MPPTIAPASAARATNDGISAAHRVFSRCIVPIASPDTMPATTPISAKPSSSRGSLHDELGAASNASPPRSARCVTAAATAPRSTPATSPRSPLPNTSSNAKTTPVIGVLKIAAIPAATPTGIIPRTSLRGSFSARPSATAIPLEMTTIGPSGPSGAPAPSDSGVVRNVASTERLPSSAGSVLYAIRTRARFAPTAPGAKRRMPIAMTVKTITGVPTTATSRTMPC